MSLVWLNTSRQLAVELVSNAELSNLGGGGQFSWKWSPSKGRSGGILVGIRDSIFDIVEQQNGDHFVRLLLYDKTNDSRWNLVVVYGAAQVEHKEDFLTELSQVCQDSQYPFLLGGDFNIIRKEDEKNKSGGYNRWSFLFNAIIEQAGLRELALNGRQYRWPNDHLDPTFEKLDRILTSTDWEDLFPLSIVSAMDRVLSDHVPLLIDSGVALKKDPIFRFESSWFEREGVKEIIEKIWTSAPVHLDNLDRWQWILRNLRKKLKGWNRNVDALYKKLKKELSAKIAELDIIAESACLSLAQREEKKALELQHGRLLRQEELKWQQRSKEKEILEGDSNTIFFSC